MKIESILNQFSELDTKARDSRESPQLFSEQKEQRGPSLSLSTPSPDCAQSRTSSVRSDSRTRTPWDAGGYSLPRDIGPKNSSRPPFAPVTWEEQQESARRQNASNYHSRQVSMDTSASISLPGSTGSYALPVRRMPSTPEVHQDGWAPKSSHSERRASQHMRRSSLWTEYNTSPASGSHKISDSRSSFSSCCSSTFSAGHSRFSSVSTINGSNTINTSHERLGIEKYPWINTGESSPTPSSTSTKSPFQPQETVRMQSDGTLPGATGQAASHANPNDRVIAACRTFGNIAINVPLKGGDICMAVSDCDTDSVPRKVISHLFGRNKVCTRRIPERVWVCMCRKHYQRIRYRTGARFSSTQIEMVYEQIVRMIFWSRGLENVNRTNQEGITIRSWTFSIRRREVKRLADTNSRDPIPHWIMQSLGEGKTHDEILDVVERLCQEINHGGLREVPPVEFLPEVVDAFANPPAQVQIHQTSASSQSGRSLMAGEAVPSPLPFVKESSPLEPVQEEGSTSEHSSQQSSSSPTPPAVFNGSRPVHHSRSYTDDMSNRTAPYSFGSRSPLANSGIGPDTDRQPSLGYYDSQNPTAPSMTYSSINRQMQAPMTDHRDSCDNAPYYQQSYSGDHHYGPNGFVLTDRNLSVHTAAMPMVVRADQMYSTAGYAAQHSRDNHHFLASTVNTQLTPAPLNYPSSGTPPIQAPGAVYSYQVPEERHSHLRMSGVGNSLHHSMADERPYSDALRSQIHQPYWFSAETGSNTRIGRSMNQYQQHTLASVDQASLCSSRQYPKEEVPEYGVADLVTDEGVPTTQPAVAYRPRYQHAYASTAEFDDTLARGNYQAYQHNLSTNDDKENFHGDRASDSNHQQGTDFLNDGRERGF
ncbi:hypothetical protein AU210_008001 [Fusarium oxysporum f. sp. radicis-cucumerinum]|uniref:Uncharacterized protein n=1 Tax=Fusarium oxysporum f. sp. radicis-cucumerinum TaxID=327505 RepID=A0A2H3GY81_FUSOX|nr:hypothetical protein AU210_008001 [Fusarium oxysporum f. sp. radicis-cucumerinum]